MGLQDCISNMNLCFIHPELHIYEGFIGREERQGILLTGLQMVGLKRERGAELSDAWLASAPTLLDRIFQKWCPSDTQSTQRLCSDLLSFRESLGSAHTRVTFPDKSRPPAVTVGAATTQNSKLCHKSPVMFHH